MITDADYPLALVAHDAGGANQITYWLKQQIGINMRRLLPVFEGPARSIWLRMFPDIAPVSDLSHAIENATCLIAGTGWATNLEFHAFQLAKDRGIRAIAYLDHWVGYRERFARHGITASPSEIWCSDTYAVALARALFGGITIRLVGDFYLQAQIRQAGSWLIEDAEVLYLTEPRHDRWGKEQPAEFQALEFFLSHRAAVGIPNDAPIVIRPHPSEALEKYTAWAANQKAYPLSVKNHATLGEALSTSRWVIGCESHAMAVALAAGRTVICALPPWAPPCRLPHSRIIHLANFFQTPTH